MEQPRNLLVVGILKEHDLVFRGREEMLSIEGGHDMQHLAQSAPEIH